MTDLVFIPRVVDVIRNIQVDKALDAFEKCKLIVHTAETLDISLTRDTQAIPIELGR